MTKAAVYVVTHKPYRMPEDGLYVPLQVGAVNDHHFLSDADDTGENISAKNPHFCELTGLYWIWKNSQFEVAGLAHYRRHFCRRGFLGDPWKRILTRKDVEKLLQKTDVILPKPRHYWIETNYSHYAHAHHEQDLRAARDCIEAFYPDYLLAFDAVMRKTSGHRFNMLIMKKPLLDQYCAWLFSVLFRLEEKIDITEYDAYNARVFGFIGERLLDVWIAHNRVPYAEVPVVQMEGVNWLQKGWRFLKRKFAAPAA